MKSLDEMTEPEVLLPYLLDDAGRKTMYEVVKERHLSLPGPSR